MKNRAAPVTLQRTDPEGKIPGPHSRLLPPGGSLGTVPRVLAPSQELQDEVRTSAQDRVATQSPAPSTTAFPDNPKFPKPPTPHLAPEKNRGPQSQPHTFRGRWGDLAHPAHLCSLGPGCHRRLAVPRPERIHFGLRGHNRGELLLRGVKRGGRDGDGDRGRRAGGRHSQAGLLGGGSSGYAERCRADTPRSKSPSVTPPSPPRVPFPGLRSFSPRLTAGRSVRAASRMTASAPSPRTLRPGPEQLLAKRGGTTRKGREGGGGERAAPRPYKERPGEGAGRGRGGRTGQETPPGRGPGPALGCRLCKGPPAASLRITAPAGHRPPFPSTGL